MYVGSTCVCVCAYTYAHLFTSPRCASLLDFLVGAFCKDKLIQVVSFCDSFFLDKWDPQKHPFFNGKIDATTSGEWGGYPIRRNSHSTPICSG